MAKPDEMAYYDQDDLWKVDFSTPKTGWMDTPTEMRVIANHVDTVDQMLVGDDPLLGDIRKAVREHHERGDGSGYPRGLKKGQISPAGARLAVTDCYDELLEGLTESPPMIPAEALRFLYTHARSEVFQVAVVEQLVKLLGVYPVGSALRLNTGEKALVLKPNRDKTLLPTVKICYDRNGAAMPLATVVDLGLQEGSERRTIEDVFDPTEAGMDPANLLRMGD